MKERPIIMGAESVRAILEGRKTQTRRVVKHIPALGWVEDWCHRIDNADFKHIVGDYRRFCPYGKVGDRLWVREKYGFIGKSFDEPSSRIAYSTAVAPNGEMKNIIYYTDCPDMAWCDGDGYTLLRKNGQEASFWNSPLFMPRWASRITLEITDIRVERVQDISEENAIAEGIESFESPLYASAEDCENGEAPIEVRTVYRDYSIKEEDNEGYNFLCHAKDSYCTLWDSLNAKRGYPWEKNPWVWVLTFKVVQP